jgi:hypothetical protein
MPAGSSSYVTPQNPFEFRLKEILHDAATAEVSGDYDGLAAGAQIRAAESIKLLGEVAAETGPFNRVLNQLKAVLFASLFSDRPTKAATMRAATGRREVGETIPFSAVAERLQHELRAMATEKDRLQIRSHHSEEKASELSAENKRLKAEVFTLSRTNRDAALTLESTKNEVATQQKKMGEQKKDLTLQCVVLHRELKALNIAYGEAGNEIAKLRQVKQQQDQLRQNFQILERKRAKAKTHWAKSRLAVAVGSMQSVEGRRQTRIQASNITRAIDPAEQQQANDLLTDLQEAKELEEQLLVMINGRVGEFEQQLRRPGMTGRGAQEAKVRKVFIEETQTMAAEHEKVQGHIGTLLQRCYAKNAEKLDVGDGSLFDDSLCGVPRTDEAAAQEPQKAPASGSAARGSAPVTAPVTAPRLPQSAPPPAPKLEPLIPALDETNNPEWAEIVREIEYSQHISPPHATRLFRDFLDRGGMVPKLPRKIPFQVGILLMQ